MNDMTSDRKKAIFFLCLTLVIGILIGSLVPAFYGRMRHGNIKQGKDMGDHQKGSREGKPTGNREEWLTNTIIRVVKPDSDQVKSIRTITMDATQQISSLEKKSNERMIGILDSMKLKLKPILTEDQNKTLEEFSKKARSRWKGVRK